MYYKRIDKNFFLNDNNNNINKINLLNYNKCIFLLYNLIF